MIHSSGFLCIISKNHQFNPFAPDVSKQLEVLSKNTNDQDFIKFSDIFQKNFTSLQNLYGSRPLSRSEQRKIERVLSFVSKECRMRRRRFINKFPHNFLRRLDIRQEILRRVFPQDAREITAFLKSIKLKHCEEKIFTGKSLFFPFKTHSGKEGMIKFRILDEKPQVLVCREIGKGGFCNIQAVGIVAGPKIKNTPLFFARKSLREEAKDDPVTIEALRNESKMVHGKNWGLTSRELLSLNDIVPIVVNPPTRIVSCVNDIASA